MEYVGIVETKGSAFLVETVETVETSCPRLGVFPQVFQLKRVTHPFFGGRPWWFWFWGKDQKWQGDRPNIGLKSGEVVFIWVLLSYIQIYTKAYEKDKFSRP